MTPSPCSPAPPLWQPSVCSLFLWVWFCLFWFFEFHIQVKSRGVCLSLTFLLGLNCHLLFSLFCNSMQTITLSRVHLSVAFPAFGLPLFTFNIDYTFKRKRKEGFPHCVMSHALSALWKSRLALSRMSEVSERNRHLDSDTWLYFLLCFQHVLPNCTARLVQLFFFPVNVLINAVYISFNQKEYSTFGELTVWEERCTIITQLISLVIKWRPPVAGSCLTGFPD